MPLVLIYFHYCKNPFIKKQQQNEEDEPTPNTATVAKLGSSFSSGLTYFGLVVEILFMGGMLLVIRAKDNPFSQIDTLFHMMLFIHLLKYLFEVVSSLIERITYRSIYSDYDANISKSHSSLIQREKYVCLSLTTLVVIIFLTMIGLFNISLYLLIVVIVNLLMILCLFAVEMYHYESSKSSYLGKWVNRIAQYFGFAMLLVLGCLLHPLFVTRFIEMNLKGIYIAWVEVRVDHI